MIFCYLFSKISRTSVFHACALKFSCAYIVILFSMSICVRPLSLFLFSIINFRATEQYFLLSNLKIKKKETNIHKFIYRNTINNLLTFLFILLDREVSCIYVRFRFKDRKYCICLCRIFYHLI